MAERPSFPRPLSLNNLRHFEHSHAVLVLLLSWFLVLVSSYCSSLPLSTPHGLVQSVGPICSSRCFWLFCSLYLQNLFSSTMPCSSNHCWVSDQGRGTSHTKADLVSKLSQYPSVPTWHTLPFLQKLLTYNPDITVSLPISPSLFAHNYSFSLSPSLSLPPG